MFKSVFFQLKTHPLIPLPHIIIQTSFTLHIDVINPVSPAKLLAFNNSYSAKSCYFCQLKNETTNNKIEHTKTWNINSGK